MKTNLNKQFEKLPTSNLVYYMTTTSDESVKSSLVAILYSRLLFSYKLNLDVAKKFVAREEEIIEYRGSNIETYAFGKAMTFDELSRTFYENAGKISPVLDITNNFNTLTMSELVIYSVFFGDYRDKFKKREKMRPSEHTLTEYNGILSDAMDNKISTIMEYDPEKIRTIITYLKEAYYIDKLLFTKRTSIVAQEKKMYDNILFDAYAHYTAIPSEYGVKEFQLTKKK